MAIQVASGTGTAVYSAQNSKANEVSERTQAVIDRPAPATKDTSSSGSKGSILNPKDIIDISRTAQDVSDGARTDFIDVDVGDKRGRRIYQQLLQTFADEAMISIEFEKNRIEQLEKTDPVPAEKLDVEEIRAVIKALKESGSNPTSLRNEDNIFILGDYNYTFKPDGSVYKNQHGVPTSEEQRQGLISAYTESIQEHKEYLNSIPSQLQAYDESTGNNIEKAI